MNNQFKTEQENFWAGKFGDQYAHRNQGGALIAANLSLFARILQRTHSVKTTIEFGANIGLNLAALRTLLSTMELSAIEINNTAITILKEQGEIKIYPQSILEFEPDYRRNLVLIKGVLTHINPNSLAQVYDLLYETSNHYICLAEYYNPSPVEVPYRGYTERLFKRDFAGEMMDRFPDLKLIDYGFSYHRDNNFPQDDITWFLLEKTVT